MALILHIETATPTCSIALTQDGLLLSLKEETAQQIHAGVITLFIESVMHETGKKLNHLDAVCVSKGPGSYTGLRIGVSTAKGLCYALDKPLIAVNTLEAMASGLLNTPGAAGSAPQGAAGSALQGAAGSAPQGAAGSALQGAGETAPRNTLLCPMIDARRMEVFMAVYQTLPAGDLRQLEAPRAQVMQEDSLESSLLQGNAEGKKNTLLLFGTGAEKCRTLYENRPEIKIISGFRQSAVHMALPAEQKFNGKHFEDVAYFEPFYLKEFISTSALRQPGDIAKK